MPDQQNKAPETGADGNHGILPCSDGSAIAYRTQAGKKPTVVFIHGFGSTMTGIKATAIGDFCRERGQAFVCFDLYGCGSSEGRFEEGTVDRWLVNVLNVIDRLVEGPLVLVGSSMGGWLALLATLRRRARVVGMMGLAAAPDFTEVELWPRLSDEQKRRLWADKRIQLPKGHEEGEWTLTRDLIESGRNNLLLGDTINISCPVRLIHGKKDEDIPWKTALELQDYLLSDDVEVTLLKESGHRLSEPDDIVRILETLESLLRDVERD